MPSVSKCYRPVRTCCPRFVNIVTRHTFRSVVRAPVRDPACIFKKENHPLPNPMRPCGNPGRKNTWNHRRRSLPRQPHPNRRGCPCFPIPMVAIDHVGTDGGVCISLYHLIICSGGFACIKNVLGKPIFCGFFFLLPSNHQ